MSFHATVLRRSFPVVFLLGWIASSPAIAQAPDSPVVFDNHEAITTTFVTAPSVNSPDASAPAPPSDNNKWLQVEFHYAVTPAVGDFLEAVEFKVWIEGRDLLDPLGQPDQGIAVALTGSVTYVMVHKSKDAYGVFYVHPSVLARYSTRAGYTDFERKFNVHIEAYVGGQKMDYFDKNKDPQGPDWYKTLRVVPNLVYRQDQSPFLISNLDRYPMIKLPSAQ